MTLGLLVKDAASPRLAIEMLTLKESPVTYQSLSGASSMDASTENPDSSAEAANAGADAITSTPSTKAKAMRRG